MQRVQRRHAATVLRSGRTAIPTAVILQEMLLLSAISTARQPSVSITKNVHATPERSVLKGAMPASAGRQNVPHLTVGANKVMQTKRKARGFPFWLTENRREVIIILL